MKRPIGSLAVLGLILLAVPGVSCTSAPPREAATSADTVAFPSGVSDDAWPRWGGPSGDFQVEASGLAESWPIEGPPELWRRPLGPGYSAVIATRGALITLYRDGEEDVFVALDADNGEEIWSYRYEAPTRDGNQTQFGSGPNATPVVHGDRVIGLGYAGRLSCLELRTGEPVWSHELIDDLGGEILNFGYSASPIVHDGKVIVLVGGDHAVMAFDPADGSVAWKSDPGSVSYATPTVIDVDGLEQLVYFSADEVIGLDASDGRRLWSRPCANQYSNNATDARWDGESLLWAATQLDGGTRVLKLSGETAEEVWSSTRISIHFWNSLLLGDHVYASIGGQASQLAAIELATGEIVWRERGFQQANLLQAGDRTIALDENGQLALLDLSPEGLRIDSQVQITEERTWTPPTLVGTVLIVRDQESIRALQLGEASAP